ncbi:hypothetical protein R3W88_027214 [Solanum pinnatisectum]|uniref:Uncharacterized protein n=1 Tax=Solanum pinnatisectum TaxID=50273 RepID=A0AAV9LFC5_9SOLN|nr:hypothetical protein R3W88_027214 [Solanum pinnatisectum]
MERGPTQPHFVLYNTLILQELIVRLLDRLNIALSIVLASGSPIIVDVAPRVQGPSMGFDTLGSSSVPSIAPPWFATPTISFSVTMSIA